MYFVVNASIKPLDVATSNCIGHMMCRVLGKILFNRDPKVKIKSEKAGHCDGVKSTAV